jgi:carbamoyl-phosphate synthase large subunit
MNILLTSVGRRNYLVKYFKEVLHPIGGKVYALNSNIDSPALLEADQGDICPMIYDATYAEFLLNYCNDNNIDVIISLFDIELPRLSSLKSEFLKHNISIIVADEEITKIANDKWLTQDFLRVNEFNTIPSFIRIEDFKIYQENHKITYPVFIKPRWGMGSIGVYKAENLIEVMFYFNKTKQEIERSYLKYESMQDLNESVLIQIGLPGEEYGLDIINDLEGNYQTTIVKKKIAMRSGETDVAITVDEPMLKQLGEKLAKISKHPANMDVDVFFDGQTPYILEINPRFGGGYPFSHVSGVDLPQAIVKWYKNKTANCSEILTPKIGVKAYKGIEMYVG